MKRIHGMMVLLLALLLLAPGTGSATVPDAAVFVGTDEYLASVVVSGGYEYTIFAWKQPALLDESEHVRMFVRRIPWDSFDWEFEEARLSPSALSMVQSEDGYTMILDATLPTMGKFTMTFTGAGPAPRLWQRDGDAVWSSFGFASRIDWAHHIVGGADSGFTYAEWGRNAAGVVSHLAQ